MSITIRIGPRSSGLRANVVRTCHSCSPELVVEQPRNVGCADREVSTVDESQPVLLHRGPNEPPYQVPFHVHPTSSIAFVRSN